MNVSRGTLLWVWPAQYLRPFPFPATCTKYRTSYVRGTVLLGGVFLGVAESTPPPYRACQVDAATRSPAEEQSGRLVVRTTPHGTTRPWVCVLGWRRGALAWKAAEEEDLRAGEHESTWYSSTWGGESREVRRRRGKGYVWLAGET
jgi:hypothetical protein